MTLEKILEGESKNLEFKVQRPKDSTKYMKSASCRIHIFNLPFTTTALRSLRLEVCFRE